MSRKKDISQFFMKRSDKMVSSQIQINKGILWYGKGKKKFWDISAFRPCLSSTFEENKKYNVLIKMGKENLLTGEEVMFPEYIVFQKKKFLNIR